MCEASEACRLVEEMALAGSLLVSWQQMMLDSMDPEVSDSLFSSCTDPADSHSSLSLNSSAFSSNLQC